jgi:hypothetical protein
MALDICRLWRADTEDQREVMVIPYLKDCDDWRKADQVKAQCHRCAEQLAPYFYRWEKKFPERSTVKTWDACERKFRGVDLDLFTLLIEERFRIDTADHRQWRLDKKIAAKIWEQCIAADSPLPAASWTIEAEKRKAAGR